MIPGQKQCRRLAAVRTPAEAGRQLVGSSTASRGGELWLFSVGVVPPRLGGGEHSGPNTGAHDSFGGHTSPTAAKLRGWSRRGSTVS